MNNIGNTILDAQTTKLMEVVISHLFRESKISGKNNF